MDPSIIALLIRRPTGYRMKDPSSGECKRAAIHRKMEKPVNTRRLSLHSFTSAGNNTKVTVPGLRRGFVIRAAAIRKPHTMMLARLYRALGCPYAEIWLPG